MELSQQQFESLRRGYHRDPSRSFSLCADAYTQERYFELDQTAILSKSWQWICHEEKLREPGAYVTTRIAGHPVAILRDRQNNLRAFYNVCKHRAHELLRGEGEVSRILCPYHAWLYRLDGSLARAPHSENLVDFDIKDIRLDSVQVESFCGFVYVNLDPNAKPLKEQSGELEQEIRHWAPDVEHMTFGHRLTYNIRSNWKNVVDNFLECYHCPTAHKDFCEPVDIDSYRVTTHGIYSSHMADASNAPNTAYDVPQSTV